MFRNASRPQPRHRKAGRAVVRRRGADLKLPAFLDAPDFDGDIDAWVNFPDPLDPAGALAYDRDLIDANRQAFIDELKMAPLGSSRVNAIAYNRGGIVR